MIDSSLLRVLAALGLGLAVLTPVGAGQEFLDGDLAKLSARVSKTKPLDGKRKGDSFGTLLTIEIRNGTTLSVEPVAIEVSAKKTLRDKKPVTMTVRRFDGASFGRAGRAVRPGRALTYRFAVPWPLTTRCGLTAKVKSASFFRGAGVDRFALKAGSRKRGSFTLGTMRLKSTTVRVKNPLDAIVDVAFLAKMDKPYDGIGIVRRRLEPNEIVDWEIRSLRTSVPNQGVCEGVDIGRLELIDWSVIRSDGANVARAAFEGAYRAWYRWPEKTAVTGRFAFHEHYKPSALIAGAKPYEYRETGRFTLDATGEIAIDPDGTIPPRPLKGLKSALASAFGLLRRPSIARVAEKTKFKLLEHGARTSVGFEGGGWSETDKTIQGVGIEGGRIIGTLFNGRVYDHYRTVAHGDRYLVVGRRLEPNPGQKTQRWTRIVHGEADGLVVPATYARMWNLGGPQVTRLTLSTIRRVDVETAAAAGAPAGSGAAALRAVWDGTYRVSDASLTVTARFIVKNDGKTEALWEGVKQVAGRVKIDGYRGRVYSKATVALDGKFADEQRSHFEEMVMDRFRIWFHRNFNGRAAFDDAFRGATIEPKPDAPGVFVVANGPYARVETANNRVTALIGASTRRTTLKYVQVSGKWLCTEVRTGDERVAATYRDAGAAMFPIAMTFERVFGADWGPESVKLQAVKAVPAR